MKIDYVEVSLDRVIEYFAKDFTTKDGSPSRFIESFIDVTKGRVIFKLYKEDDVAVTNTKE